MTVTQIAEYVRGNSKALDVLRAAVDHEEAHVRETGYLGWEWYDVRAYPATLMKLVVDGLIRVHFKSNSSTCYLLADRSSVKQVLAGYKGK